MQMIARNITTEAAGLMKPTLWLPTLQIKIKKVWYLERHKNTARGQAKYFQCIQGWNVIVYLLKKFYPTLHCAGGSLHDIKETCTTSVATLLLRPQPSYHFFLWAPWISLCLFIDSLTLSEAMSG